METNEREEWKQRADATGRAQSRYLWTAAVAGVFFFALKQSIQVGSAIKVPIVEMDLDAGAVLAAGGAVISLLLIAIHGAMRAWGDAMKNASGDNWREHAERLDMHPTVLDLAYYTVRRRLPRFETALYFLLYPAFFALLLWEAATLQLWLYRNDVPAGIVFLVVGSIFWVWAAALVAETWIIRVLHVIKQNRAM